jgi:hypothetical protein
MESKGGRVDGMLLAIRCYINGNSLPAMLHQSCSRRANVVESCQKRP